MDKSSGVTMGMIECIRTEFKHQGARLNQAYKALIVALNPAADQPPASAPMTA